MFRKLTLSIVLFTTLAGLLLGAPSSTSIALAETDDGLADVLSKVDVATQNLRGKGYNIAAVYIDREEAGGTRDITRTLNAGNDYMLFGAGEDCISDLDLAVYNSSGTLIASDTDESQYAGVSVHVSFTGQFTTSVKIYDVQLACASSSRDYHWAVIFAFKR